MSRTVEFPCRVELDLSDGPHSSSLLLLVSLMRSHPETFQDTASVLKLADVIAAFGNEGADATAHVPVCESFGIGGLLAEGPNC